LECDISFCDLDSHSIVHSEEVKSCYVDTMNCEHRVPFLGLEQPTDVRSFSDMKVGFLCMVPLRPVPWSPVAEDTQRMVARDFCCEIFFSFASFFVSSFFVVRGGWIGFLFELIFLCCWSQSFLVYLYVYSIISLWSSNAP